MITKAQWAEITERMGRMFVNEEFELDGRRISVNRVRRSESITCLAVYIDGVIRPAAGMKDSEHFDPLTEKVWRKKEVRLYSRAKAAQIRKKFGVRKSKEFFGDLDKANEYLESVFPSAKVLVGQLKKIDGLIWKQSETA